MISRLLRFTAWSLICAILITLALTNLAAAQTPGGGPDEAMAPPSGWMEIRTGESHWYAFNFAYDEARADPPIEIRIYDEPFAGAVLTIRNEEQAQIWRRDGKEAHFGCCTPVDVDKNRDGQPDYSLWSGTLRVSGKYYIVVEHARNLTQPVRYRMEITGNGISFPAKTTQAAPRAVPPLELTKAVLSKLPGTGPDFAIAPPSGWTELKAGEIRWYAFDFGYDAKREDPVIELKVWSEPNAGALVTLRNEENANTWRKDGKHESFGRATPVAIDRDGNGLPDYSLWAGELRVSGRYYLVVEHTKDFSKPVYYRMELSGKGFSFPGEAVMPAAAVVAAIAPQPPAVTGLSGTGPDYAMRPTGAEMVIQSGQYHWYAFHFGYDEKYAGQPVTVRLYSEPHNGAVLTLRTTEQADLWRRDGTHEHFGCCTNSVEALDKEGNYLYTLWSGTLRESGTYYLVVEHAPNLSGAVTYHFSIEGAGVSY